MRVTESMIYRNAQSQIGRAQLESFSAQQRAATGVRLEGVSEDPFATVSARHAADALRQLQSMQQVADHAEARLEVTESYLIEASDVLVRAKEIAIAAANATHSDLQGYLQEVNQLQTALLSTANAQHQGQYIFSGNQVNAPAFDPAGAYLGDQGVRSVEISPGRSVTQNLTGNEVFAPGAGVDAFAVLSDLAAALSATDPDAVRMTLSDLDTAHEQVVNARALVGTRLAFLEDTRQHNEELQLSLEETRSRLIGIDPIDAVLELTQAQTHLDEVLAQATRILRDLGENPLRLL